MKKESKNTFIKLDAILLTVILLVGLAFRLYKIDAPLADSHSWRQADTAAVARNFVKDGFDLLHPRNDDLSNKQFGENPKGYHFVEFPLYNATFAALYTVAPIIAIEVWGRIISTLFSLIIVAVIYYFGLRENGRLTAVSAAAVYALFPFFVLYSRIVLPEVTALSLCFLSIYCLYRFSEQKTKLREVFFFIASLLFFTLSLLIKPTVVFYGVVLLYLFIKKYRISFLTHISFYLFFLLSGIPLVLWRMYIQQYPEGIPISGWLITSVHTYEGLRNIFFKPAFFRWIFFERINNLILGGYATFFLLVGAMTKLKTNFLHTILFSALLYLFTFQGGNVQHDYYQILILPALAIFIGVGVQYLIQQQKNFIHPFIKVPVILAVLLFSFAMSYYFVKDKYSYSSDLVKIAEIVQTLTPENEKIITDRLGDTTLLYLANRRGSPVLSDELAALKKKGYKYFVTLNTETIEKTKNQNFTVIFENDKFALFEL